MQDNIEIVVADDHELIREGLSKIIKSKTGYSIFEASNGEEALNLIHGAKPQIAILDIEMPIKTGFEVANSIHKEGLSTSVIFLTMYKDEVIFNKAMDIGVKGYILKENTVTEIVNCIESVLKGDYYLSPEISSFLVKRNLNQNSPAVDTLGINLLSSSERRILRLIANLKSNQEIADELGISIKTVHNHRHNISQKLSISGNNALMKFATQHLSLI